ncbi:hypothetical protein BH23ACT9_BH23ACT9_17150 [soil metagenome]
MGVHNREFDIAFVVKTLLADGTPLQLVRIEDPALGGDHGRGHAPRRGAGSLDTVVELPVAQVTSCTFGGQDLDLLFVTSAATGVTGVAPSPFLG